MNNSYVKNNGEWLNNDYYRRKGGEWAKHSAYARENGKWTKIVAVEKPEEIVVENCLTFSSAEPFTVATYSGKQYWDGALYYSTDTITWSEWDGTEIASAEHDGEQRIYMRGSGNSVITGGTSSNYKWVLTGSRISCTGNIETLLDYEVVANGEHPTMANYCYQSMFYGCESLVTAPELPATILSTRCYYSMFKNCTALVGTPALPATTLSSRCYYSMFYGCTSLTTLPELSATLLKQECYRSMFSGCTNIKLSSTQSAEYQNEYRVPTSGTGTLEDNMTENISNMFYGTGGTFTGTPEINTTYYTSNTVV